MNGYRIVQSIVIVLVASFTILTPGIASDTGITGIDPTTGRQPQGIDQASTIPPTVPEISETHSYLSPWLDGRDEWLLLEQQSYSLFVPAGEQCAIGFDPLTESIVVDDPTLELSEIQQQAIARAPAWLRPDLYDNFKRFLYSMVADEVAQEILDAPDPYVDEVAFQAAHIAPGMLSGMYKQLLLENAEDVYAVDDDLHYVDIVDYGDSNEDDYWSTLTYTVIEEDGDTTDVEMDRYYYYWFVVHPKLSDEKPTYINPANGQEQSPPWGYFWRDYLWNHADAGYPLFSEAFGDCEILWDRTGGGNDAIGVLNVWIEDVMDFGAGAERPIQPVRIYTLHCGNCGEYQDMRAAAGRIALLPTACTCNLCEDHVWNEFFEREWIHWDGGGGSLNNPLLYENGWGKTLSAVYNWRGDGYIWTVTDRYSSGVSILNVSLFDQQGKPADGYKVTIDSEALWGGFWEATFGVTNAQGEVSIPLGDDQNYYLRIDGPLGNYPAFETIQVIANSQAGVTYYWDHTLPEASGEHRLTTGEDPQNPDDHYRIDLSYDVEYELAYAQFFNLNDFSKQMDTGWIDFFLLDQGNYNQYVSNQPVEGYGIQHNSHYGSASWVLPTYEPWYGVFSARESVVNCARVNVNLDVYYNTESAVSQSGEDGLPREYALISAYPNPFNSQTNLNFAVPQPGPVRIEVFNLLGQKMKTLTDRFYQPGRYSVTWDGKTSRTGEVGSGIYLVKMNTGNADYQRKICYLR